MEIMFFKNLKSHLSVYRRLKNTLQCRCQADFSWERLPVLGLPDEELLSLVNISLILDDGGI